MISSGPSLRLFMAIVLIDLIAVYCLYSGNDGHEVRYALNLWSGFAIGQMSLVAIWLNFRRKYDLASWLVSAVVLLLASYIRLQLRFMGGFTYLDYVCRTGLQALIPFVVLWPV